MAVCEEVNGRSAATDGSLKRGQGDIREAGPEKLDIKSHPSSSSGGFGAEQRRSTATGPALDVLQSVQALNQHHPIYWPAWQKWVIVTIYCTLQIFVTLTSTTYVSVEPLIGETFDVSSSQVLALGQSMFIVGTAVGPAFLGPLSDIGGRKWVYVIAMVLYAALNVGCALALNLPMLITFMFLIGVVGSVALCNVAGTIADLFGDSDGAGQPMAMFVAAANWGPSLGSPVGEWIAENEWLEAHSGWAWIYWINIIAAIAFALGMSFIPETLPRIVIAKAARKDPVYANDTEVALIQGEIKVLQEIRFVATMALRLMIFEPIIAFMAIYNGWAYGLLFLYLDGVFSVFAVNNGLSIIDADLTFLDFLVGVTIMFCFVPIQTWLYRRDRRKNSGVGRPEARFLTSLGFVWGFPISLFWFAFTSMGSVSYWSPVIAGGLLSFSDSLLWLSMLNYLTDSYPNVAASAIAAFLIPSFLLAAAFTHIGILMFEDLSSQWAFAILGFTSLGIVVLVYAVYFYGPWLRKRSKLAKNF